VVVVWVVVRLDLLDVVDDVVIEEPPLPPPPLRVRANAALGSRNPVALSANTVANRGTSLKRTWDTEPNPSLSCAFGVS
jgi:hypothetical protein